MLAEKSKSDICQRVSVPDAAAEIGCDPHYLRIMMRNKKWDLGAVVPPKKVGGKYQYLIFRKKLDRFLGLEEEAI